MGRTKQTKQTTRKSTGGMAPRMKMAPQQAAKTGKMRMNAKKALVMREAGGPPQEGADPQRERVWDRRLRSQFPKPTPGMALRQDVG